MGKEKIAVAVVDDDSIVRSAVASYLATDPMMDLVAVGVDGQEAIDIVRSRQVDVLVMDIRMPILDGIAATTEIRRLSPGTKILLLTSIDADLEVQQAMAAGANGYLLKDTPVQALVEGVRSVHLGNMVMSSCSLSRVITPPPAAGAADVKLSERELGVLRLLCRGFSNDEIAEEFSLSDSTVKTHVSSVIAKMGVTSRLKAVARAFELGLVRPGV